MVSFSFAGAYEDDAGREEIRWEISPSQRSGWQGRYEISTTIRGVAVWGGDFDGLEPEGDAAAANGQVKVDEQHGELTDCVLSGELPCVVDFEGERRETSLGFSLDLRRDPLNASAAPGLRLSIVLDGGRNEVVDEWFEDGVHRLESQLPQGHRLVCCVTCLFSDYSPGGHGLMGMSCHRGAKEQYLAVRSKWDYWSVPVTEEVPETYVCPEYVRRVPGTGYRG